MKRDPVYAFLLAVVQAALGYWFLTHGYVLVGAFFWWACGVNCGISTRKHRFEEISK